MTRQRIPAFRLSLEPMEPAAVGIAGFRWAGGDIGRRNQLGGEPADLQDTDWPMCPSCREEMTFYGQLDSLNDEIVLADAGLIQVFVCFDCLETSSRLVTA